MRTVVRTYVLGFEEVITMKVYSARCPDCGFMNRGLYLEETDGWFECEPELPEFFSLKQLSQSDW